MPPPPNTHLPEKPCAACGRSIVWRKKWERDWDSVRYCSDACRRSGLSDQDRQLELEILAQLSRRARDASICPSEVARAVDPADWRSLLEPVRRAARRLAARGRVRITQQGRAVDPSTARGPIRIAVM
ncbi:MAG: DUF3253 domain-containing protein [Planctomycetota bacterium]|nr:DUF3253 domain-containing protein [Planctomycetota bacterium]